VNGRCTILYVSSYRVFVRYTKWWRYSILLYSLQYFKKKIQHTVPCTHLTAVHDEIKLSTVESYMCWSGKITDIFEEFVPCNFILHILILWCRAKICGLGVWGVAWQYGKQTLCHIQSEKSTLQGCVIIGMFTMMTSIIVWFSVNLLSNDCRHHLAPKG
jgi:hypothetical protein